MAKEERRESIRQAVKDRIKQSEELQIIQMITAAVGERRYRDLEDMISQLEQDHGWPHALKLLSKIRKCSYHLPIGVGPRKTSIEELKYRETMFALLQCTGFEPIPLTMKEVLSKIQNEDSLIDASKSFYSNCESVAIEQIESGDTLFFNLNNPSISISSEVVNLLEETQHNNILSQLLSRYETTINILPLWYSEKGRQSLSQLGIKGIEIDSESFDIVLSVLQLSLNDVNFTETQIKEDSLIHPSNPLYDRLLTTIIHQDIKNLNVLASIHSVDTLKFILDNSIDHYSKSPTSSAFRNVLSCINSHIRVRSLESIGPLEKLAHSTDTRISTIAITALGNFYTESAASALVDILCKTRKKELLNITTRAIKNVSKRCLETKYLIKQVIDSQDCINLGHVKRLFKDIWTKSDDYYL